MIADGRVTEKRTWTITGIEVIRLMPEICLSSI